MKPENWNDVQHRTLQALRSGFRYDDVDLLAVFNGTLNSASVKLTEGARPQIPASFRFLMDKSQRGRCCVERF